MASQTEGEGPRSVVGTFVEPGQADLAADAARKAGYRVERGNRGEVVVEIGHHRDHIGEIEGILAAYGARSTELQDQVGVAAAGAADEPAGSARSSGTRSSGARSSGGRAAKARARDQEQGLVRAEHGTKVELVEEQLRPRTRAVQTGEVTIRKEVVTETRTIEVPVRREELVIERHPVERQAFDQAGALADPLVGHLVDRLRHMQSGEVLRIPIVEEEVIVHKRPVVVEEIEIGKRVIQESQEVSATVRRERARIKPHGDVRLNKEE